MRRALGLVSCLALAIGLAGCPPPVPPPPPPGPCGALGCVRDAGRPIERDAGFDPPAFDVCRELSFGATCDETCGGTGALSCFRERRTTATVAAPPDAGVPLDAGAGDPDASVAGGPSSLEVVAFPGGLCTAPCASDADCGPTGCAACVPHVLAGRARLRGLVPGSGVCRPRCDPDFDACGPGYACDPATRTCLEACRSDEQCRFRTEDLDMDGTDDALAYDADLEVSCSPITRRCVAPPEPFGGACSDTIGCEPGYACARARDAGAGRCALGCDPGSDLCGEDAACVLHAELGTYLCAARCEVGADAPEDVAGSDGHGAGCAPGFRCAWDRRGPEPVGGCVPGRYNDVGAPNTGAPCRTDDECWSPYGLGVCITPHEHVTQGICAVLDCVPGASPPALVPGVPAADPATFCDPARSLSCVTLFTDTSDSACVQSCTTIDECPPGWACTRLFATGERACAPNCEADSDCGLGGRCQYMDTSPCAGRPGACFCR